MATLGACSRNGQVPPPPQFTKADSLTEQYLEIQEGMFTVWKRMMHDDKKKIHALHDVIHELMHSGGEENAELVTLRHRLNALMEQPVTPEILQAPGQLEEYDFTMSSLVTEVVSLAEAHSTYSYNKTLQKLVEEIKMKDQLVESNRARCDSVTRILNQFVSDNKDLVREIDHKATLEDRPLFGVAKE
jgi:hypothetical protein